MAKRNKAKWTLPQPDKKDWVRYVALGCAGAVGSYAAFCLAISGVTRTKNPQVALQFTPNESRALAVRAEQIYFKDPKNPPALVEKLALQSLQGQAVNPIALRVLGYYASSTKQNGAAKPFILATEKMSRREAGAQLWLLDQEARSNNVAQTLKHYDILLRTKPESQSVLYPRLLAAVSNNELRTALTPYIKGKHLWAEGFLTYATNTSRDLPALVDLVIKSGGLSEPEAARLMERRLLTRLVDDGLYSDARRLFLAIPQADQSILTNPAFHKSDVDQKFSSIGWQMLDNADAGAAWSDNAGQAAPFLSIYANAGTTRSVARKILYLQPGSYRLSTKAGEMDAGEDGYIRLQLTCPPNGTAQLLWKSGMKQQDLHGTLTVPNGCPVQFLEIVASGGSGQQGMEGALDGLSLTRI